jgi:hypothetical protein
MASTTWQDGLQRLLRRVDTTGERVTDGFPHYGDPLTGRWTTFPARPLRHHFPGLPLLLRRSPTVPGLRTGRGLGVRPTPTTAEVGRQGHGTPI